MKKILYWLSAMLLSVAAPNCLAAACGPVYGADSIAQDKDGNIWAAHYEDVRLGRLEPNNGRFEEYLPATQANAAVLNRDSWDNKEGFSYKFDFGFNGLALDDKRGLVWTLVFNSDKVVRFSRSDRLFTEIELPGRSFGRFTLPIDADGNLWVLAGPCCGQEGDMQLVKIAPDASKQVFLLQAKRAIAPNVAMAKNGKGWVSLTLDDDKQAALYAFRDRRFERIALPAEIGRIITRLHVDTQGDLWLAEGDVIWRLHNNEFKRYTIPTPGAFAAAERQRFEQWLAADPLHRRIYEQVERVWGDLPRPQAELSVARKKNSRLELCYRPLLSACAASLLLAVGLCIKEGWPLVDNSVFQTAKGELRQITLADGSQLELNSDTELAVHYTWLGRSLELVRGEALFSVAPGKLRPFEVLAGGGRLRDIGTRFDVAIGSSANRISVLEGPIDLNLPATGEQRKTGAGQVMTYNAATVLSEPVAADVKTFAVWRNHKLIFRNTQLSEVAKELERYHPVHVRLADPSLNSLTLGGVFDNNDLERFLATLEAVLPVEIKRDKNGDVLIDRRQS